MPADSGAERFIRSATGCCGGTGAPSVIRAGSRSWIARDQKDLIDTVVAAAGINPKEIRFPKGDVLAEIFSFVINTETPIDALLAEKFPYFLPLLEQIKDVHARYEKKKKNTKLDGLRRSAREDASNVDRARTHR